VAPPRNKAPNISLDAHDEVDILQPISNFPKKLKQRLVNNSVFNFFNNSLKKYFNQAMSDEIHDYSEIYTPSNEEGGKIR